MGVSSEVVPEHMSLLLTVCVCVCVVRRLESRLKNALVKVAALEAQVDRILTEKNATIDLLESKVSSPCYHDYTRFG